MTTLPDVRTTYRPQGERSVRITAEGCVMDCDMPMLQPHETHRVSVAGEIREKKFQRLILAGHEYLADVVTGTLYDAETGKSGSHQLSIIK